MSNVPSKKCAVLQAAISHAMLLYHAPTFLRFDVAGQQMFSLVSVWQKIQFDQSVCTGAGSTVDSDVEGLTIVTFEDIICDHHLKRD